MYRYRHRRLNASLNSLVRLLVNITCGMWVDLIVPISGIVICQSLSTSSKKLSEQITGFMQQLRMIKLEKTPGIAETLDWAAALSALHIDHLDKNIIEQTLGVILKDWRDTRQVQMSLHDLMDETGVVSKL